MFHSKLKIIIDTREQSPWSFPDHLAECKRGTIKTGDYCLKNDSKFAIERKSLDDFLGTISTGWNRFLREIGRMDAASFPAKVIIIEGDYERICFYDNRLENVIKIVNSFISISEKLAKIKIALEKETEIIPPKHNHPRLTPQFINTRIAELSMQGVSCLFAKNSYYSAALAYAILKQRYMEILNNGE